jgi:hypothetical protein
MSKDSGAEYVKTCLSMTACCVFLVVQANASGQQEKAPKDPAQLELAMEVATTTEDGLPAALRFTLKNAGYAAVDLPLPVIDCSSYRGTIRVSSIAHFEAAEAPLKGHICGGSVNQGKQLIETIRTTWLHLLPGEYLTFTADRRTVVDKLDAPATYEYWAVYEPPTLTPEQRRQAGAAGYLVPAEKTESDHLTYSER